MLQELQTQTKLQGPSGPVLDLRVDGLQLGGTAILGDIDLKVERLETLALVGPSGVGKTSLLRIIAGLEARHEGRCTVTGQSAMVFQEPTLLPWRSVANNICIPAGVSRSAADMALAEVGLEDRGDDYPNTLSLGQQRRLSLARAFAVRPDLLLMDEPFVSLDPDLVAEMMALFDALRAAHHVTTIIVTHVEAEAKRLASRIVTMGGAPGQITGDIENQPTV